MNERRWVSVHRSVFGDGSSLVSVVVALWCTGLFFAITPRAAAVPSGLEVLRQDWNAPNEKVESVRIFSAPDLFGESIATAWGAVLARSNESVEQQIATDAPQSLRGASLHEIVCHLSDDPEVVTEPESNAVRITVQLNNNTIQAKATSHTAADDTAPKFCVTYDATLTVMISIPSQTRPLRITGMAATIGNIHVEAPNRTADTAPEARRVLAFFASPDFRALLESRLADRSAAGLEGFLVQSLAPVNAALADLSRQGYTILNVLDTRHARGPVRIASAHNSMAFTRSAGMLLLLAYRPRYEASTVGPGSVTGTIRWPKNLVRPVGNDLPFVFTARVAAGPVTAADGPRFDLVRKTFTPPVDLHIVETAEGYVCRYRLRQLPCGAPMQLSVGLRDGVRWAIHGAQPMVPKSAAFVPQGGSGSIVLQSTPKVRPARMDFVLSADF